MTLTIELTAEEEQRIRSAQAKGLDVTAMIRGMLAALPADSVPLSETATPEEWDRAVDEFAEDLNVPSPSGEALTRAALYGHRA
jgi:cobalamin biosynthesis Mg chelatase CobN